MSISRRTFLNSILATTLASKGESYAASIERGIAPATSSASFQDFLTQRHLVVNTMTIPQLVESVLRFYQSVRASGLAADASSDMLLFQWGVFDWGKGEHFEFDITRQFISAGNMSDDAISQLRCVAYFKVTSALRSIPIANRWCNSVTEVESFSKFIFDSAAYRAVRLAKPDQVSIFWEKV